MKFRPAERRDSLTRILDLIVAISIIFCVSWNLWTFGREVDRKPPRDADEIVVREEEYRRVREILTKLGYPKGPVELINNSVRGAGASPGEDDKRWFQAQYVMLPWTLVRNGRSVPGETFPEASPRFVVGDFWEEQSPNFPPDLVPVYSGSRIVLFERKRK